MGGENGGYTVRDVAFSDEINGLLDSYESAADNRDKTDVIGDIFG